MQIIPVKSTDWESPEFRHIYRSADRVFYLSSFSRFNKKSPPKIPARRFAATSNIKTWKCLFLPIDGALTKASAICPMSIRRSNNWSWQKGRRNHQRRNKDIHASIKINGRSNTRGIGKSQQGIEHAFCKVCVIDIKVDHGGKNDLKKKHSITEKSTRLQKSQNTTAQM